MDALSLLWLGVVLTLTKVEEIGPSRLPTEVLEPKKVSICTELIMWVLLSLLVGRALTLARLICDEQEQVPFSIFTKQTISHHNLITHRSSLISHRRIGSIRPTMVKVHHPNHSIMPARRIRSVYLGIVFVLSVALLQFSCNVMYSGRDLLADTARVNSLKPHHYDPVVSDPTKPYFILHVGPPKVSSHARRDGSNQASCHVNDSYFFATAF